MERKVYIVFVLAVGIIISFATGGSIIVYNDVDCITNYELFTHTILWGPVSTMFTSIMVAGIGGYHSFVKKEVPLLAETV